MKTFDGMPVGCLCKCRCGLLILALAGFADRTQAQSVALTSGNSSVQINLDSGIYGSPGVYNWLVDGANQLNQQWFYYRVGGAGAENLINNLVATPVVTSSSANTLDATYAAGGYSIRTLYSLTGQGSGTGKANLNETITVHNASATDHLYFFQYSDFDLANSAANQSVQFYANNSGLYYKAIQTGLNGAGVTETINGLASGLYAVDSGFVDATKLGMTDAGPTTLANNLTSGPGNVAFAFEWDVAPGSTIIISKLLAVVPEPSALSLVALGGLGLAQARRRQKAK